MILFLSCAGAYTEKKDIRISLILKKEKREKQEIRMCKNLSFHCVHLGTL